jgi:Asp-tRNA(Asn)/Glu-tRNA(Gln) amidotransferase C subunit
MNGLSDEQKEQYEQQLEEVDTKALLASISAELTQIRMLLQDENKPDTTESKAMYRCTYMGCGETVREDERRDHGLTKHKAPPDLALDNFEQI